MDNSQPFKDVYFSVVIPLYNRSTLIKKTIQSVLDQKISNTLEVIVVDDGSVDDSAQEVAKINDPRVKYIYQENAGATAARNKGIDNATGKYIAFLDSDDVYLDFHLGNAEKIHIDHPDSVIYSQVIVDRGDGKYFNKPPRAINEGEHMAEYLLCDRGFLQTSTLVVPAAIAKKVRFTLGLPYGQDTDFAIRMFNEGASFIMMDTPSVIWLDVKDASRVSSKSTYAARLNWLNSVNSIITPKARVGDMGWVVAKGMARSGMKTKALSLYLKALSIRCYKPSLASIIFMQIFFPDELFRSISDTYIKLKNGVVKRDQ